MCTGNCNLLTCCRFDTLRTCNRSSYSANMYGFNRQRCSFGFAWQRHMDPYKKSGKCLCNRFGGHGYSSGTTERDLYFHGFIPGMCFSRFFGCSDQPAAPASLSPCCRNNCSTYMHRSHRVYNRYRSTCCRNVDTDKVPRNNNYHRYGDVNYNNTSIGYL